ncbi:methylated-DNA--[protein]-cysteine S-methyltransferase [Marinobacterium marinum]|uniref:Methylated-DNA--protein-cysteine methyltransferase n=1 Tax=Marinobacterium marinum TaxID=2756129 RepID=A0A7W1WW45_9GAMM|nr:methylated-DNA--[protein]-cysteine S-methyltransferase [Marinobacterium marinum]MBA4501233.1 methylated-DNA--[protein]-cysteine S-methyltransferase [Marinobacterium marinum]
MNATLIIPATPIGPLTLQADATGLCRIDFGRSQTPTPNTDEHPVLEQAAEQLRAYFAGTLTRFQLPLSLIGTPFQQAVWQALQAIPYGQVCSYADIAQAVGRPKAFRAVGMANNRNPLPIIVPCHRVVGASGMLVGYGGGLATKVHLLELEQVPLTTAAELERYRVIQTGNTP